jgi:class 3 adenylate cyclase
VWATAAHGGTLSDGDIAALFVGPSRGVFLHVGAFLGGTYLGASLLNWLDNHAIWNWRFWYSSMLAAGCTITLNAVLLEFLLARELRRTASQPWRYRAPALRLSLRDVVMFALVTLPVGVMAAVVYRHVVLEADEVTTEDLLAWLIRIGVIFTAAAFVTAALQRSVQRSAAGEALAVIRELERAIITRRARLTTGGEWGETASALNLAADALEQRARLERAMRVYVGDELADATKSADVTAARPERCRLTVLFADIRGFTSRSATIPPEEVVAMLDVYFERAVQVVEAHGGHVDKFLGDGLMAWFDELPGTADLGAPRAVEASVELLRRVEELNRELAARGTAPIQIGIGLHAGDVVRGNLGAGHRKQWTVIGDTVNLASRMEAMTKSLGRDVLFTAAVAAQLPPERVEALGEHEVRGQPSAIACFAPRADARV